VICTYYVYYKVAEPDSTGVYAAASAVIDAVRAETGIEGRLLRRRDDAHTWMEVYENVARENFETELARAVEHAGLQRHLVPGTARRFEAFVALTPSLRR